MTEVLTFAGALVFGTWMFWATWLGILVGIAVLVGLTERELYGWATTMFLAFFGILGFTGVFNLYKYTVQHPSDVIFYALCYIGIGCVWGAVKWWRFCVKHRKVYDDAKADFLRSNNVEAFTPALRVVWTKMLQDGSDRYSRHYVSYAQAPVASQSKERIMNWMYLWPFSMLGTILADFLIKIWDWIYDRMGAIYDSISRAVWKGTEQDLASEEDLKIARKLER